ncbi:winged helix-turn-helix domain-containing protein [Bradyrhizobium manausense]|uniref:winged helix-turn-helix domain-containing tetratricopeptide repeat protein n=1 Tax=Bradyrhizobium TaxID=374 RepID=UPI001BAC55CD|nr:MULTISPECIES: tetratricopeptide repeat protein [Bradyrhizobium]MBR0831431.1 winged helix-turn-helix domain-containing protein [Bradyrhizobium manausense]UVO26911.1 winged helix-turn-helix domain-containing protein [Bradyrhizobium arachidis]
MRYFFEEYALDTDRRELRRGPEVVLTPPQVFDLLEYLIRSRDCVVSKDDLVNAIWNGRIVSDAALTTRLNAVRRAIGDSGEEQRLIKTFPRRGFRFVGTVHTEERAPAARAASPADLPDPAAEVAGKVLVDAPLSPTPNGAADRNSFADVRAGTTTSDSGASGKVSETRPSGRWSGYLRGRVKLVGGALASFAAIGAIAGGLVGYWNVWKTVRTDVLREGQKVVEGQPAPKPAIAPRLSFIVLPFANLNNDPEQDYLADAVTTDLTTDLGQAPDAFVIGRETAFTFKNKPVDLKKLGTDLGIRWAIQGAVQRNGDQVRVNVSLSDLQTGGDIWSDRFDGSRASLSQLQDQITARLSRSLALQLFQAESRRSEVERSKNPASADFAMRGLARQLGELSQTSTAQARELFDKALQLDPDNVEAMIGKAGCIVTELFLGWSVYPFADTTQANELIDKALSRSPGSYRAHTVKGNLLLFDRPAQALAEFNTALEIRANFHVANAGKAFALMMLGRPREAARPAELAIRTSPRDPAAFLWVWELCSVRLHLREYEEAVEQCRRAVGLNGSFWHAQVSLISAYGSAGRLEEARQVYTELSKRRPNFSVQLYRQFAYGTSTDPEYRRGVEDILDGLRKAGVPEQ